MGPSTMLEPRAHPLIVSPGSRGSTHPILPLCIILSAKRGVAINGSQTYYFLLGFPMRTCHEEIRASPNVSYTSYAENVVLYCFYNGK